jgi:hypothetical protein
MSIVEKNTHLEKKKNKSIDDEIVELMRMRDELKDSIKKLENAREKEIKKMQLKTEVDELKRKLNKMSSRSDEQKKESFTEKDANDKDERVQQLVEDLKQILLDDENVVNKLYREILNHKTYPSFPESDRDKSYGTYIWWA